MGSGVASSISPPETVESRPIARLTVFPFGESQRALRSRTLDPEVQPLNHLRNPNSGCERWVTATRRRDAHAGRLGLDGPFTQLDTALEIWSSRTTD
jgi:hypothetical protein